MRENPLISVWISLFKTFDLWFQLSKSLKTEDVKTWRRLTWPPRSQINISDCKWIGFKEARSSAPLVRKLKKLSQHRPIQTSQVASKGRKATKFPYLLLEFRDLGGKQLKNFSIWKVFRSRLGFAYVSQVCFSARMWNRRPSVPTVGKILIIILFPSSRPMRHYDFTVSRISISEFLWPHPAFERPRKWSTLAWGTDLCWATI